MDDCQLGLLARNLHMALKGRRRTIAIIINCSSVALHLFHTSHLTAQVSHTSEAKEMLQ